MVVASVAITLAPAARAASPVPSRDRPSATITSPAHARCRTQSPICAASLSVGITTVTGERVGMTGGMLTVRHGVPVDQDARLVADPPPAIQGVFQGVHRIRFPNLELEAGTGTGEGERGAAELLHVPRFVLRRVAVSMDPRSIEEAPRSEERRVG